MRYIENLKRSWLSPLGVRRGRAPARRWRPIVLSVFAALIAVSFGGCATKPEPRHVDRVLVKKAERKLLLLNGKHVIREYRISLGDRPRGHKMEEGDERTPEGNYILDWRNPNSNFYKSIHVSYPNERDLRFAEFMGHSAGGLIMIHGQPNHVRSPRIRKQYATKDWTDGCIAVQDHEMDEIWSLVRYGTSIQILP